MLFFFLSAPLALTIALIKERFTAPTFSTVHIWYTKKFQRKPRRRPSIIIRGKLPEMKKLPELCLFVKAHVEVRCSIHKELGVIRNSSVPMLSKSCSFVVVGAKLGSRCVLYCSMATSAAFSTSVYALLNTQCSLDLDLLLATNPRTLELSSN